VSPRYLWSQSLFPPFVWLLLYQLSAPNLDKIAFFRYRTTLNIHIETPTDALSIYLFLYQSIVILPCRLLQSNRRRKSTNDLDIVEGFSILCDTDFEAISVHCHPRMENNPRQSPKAELQSSKYPRPLSTNDSESFEVGRTPDSHMQFPLLAIVCWIPYSNRNLFIRPIKQHIFCS
jgi:hypothetical protein